MSFNSGRSLAELRRQEAAILDRIELPDELAERLMLLGFFPGASVEAVQSAPGGDPTIYRIDGADVALRRETALHLKIR